MADLKRLLRNLAFCSMKRKESDMTGGEILRDRGFYIHYTHERFSIRNFNWFCNFLCLIRLANCPIWFDHAVQISWWQTEVKEDILSDGIDCKVEDSVVVDDG